ncbi:MAG: hypothetical protein M3O28_00910, partial [Actinomycetota bacterium]|nr:hypothetical protein [Actinomycetota bacterium]
MIVDLLLERVLVQVTLGRRSEAVKRRPSGDLGSTEHGHGGREIGQQAARRYGAEQGRRPRTAGGSAR